MRKWIKINGYKINITKVVAIGPIREHQPTRCGSLESEFDIEVYFSGESLLIPMPNKEEAAKAHGHLSLLLR